MSTPAADVIVVGGGPGGSTAATMLAGKGWKVVLFERETFPRSHIGESLLPASLPILEELGALPAVQEAGFLKKWGATMVWGREREPWSWHFRETNERNPHAYQVWRPEFDKILLDNSRAHGVDVRERHRVLEVLFDEGRATGVRVEHEGVQSTVRARFVVDASGQEGLLGRALRLREPDEQFRNLAMFAYFTGAEKLPSPDETNIFIESYEHGWTWVIPLHTGWTSVGFVVDSKHGQETVARLGLEGAYATQLAASGHTARMLRDATRVEGPTVIRDWSYVSREVAGDGYVLVGDAACFIDPLFSTGVHLALSAGVLGAAYVTTALKDPDMRVPAGRVYKDLYYHQYHLFRELAQLFYASNRTVDSYFWEARRIIGAVESMSPRAAFVRAAAGQPPQGYERIVLERGQAPEDVADGVRLVEEERAQRRAEVLAQGIRMAGRVPVLTPGAATERKPILGEGEFVWGHVISAPGRPDVPVSRAVAALVEAIDGTSAVRDVVERAVAICGPSGPRLVGFPALEAIGILYIDGVISELRSL
ncbi:MAG: NAD(P)/FAD-dependent oxidoreductase [Dehalococcoidia bacterium]